MKLPLFCTGIAVSALRDGYEARAIVHDSGFGRAGAVEISVATRYVEGTCTDAVRAVEDALALVPFEWREGPVLYASERLRQDEELVAYAKAKGFGLVGF